MINDKDHFNILHTGFWEDNKAEGLYKIGKEKIELLEKYLLEIEAPLNNLYSFLKAMKLLGKKYGDLWEETFFLIVDICKLMEKAYKDINELKQYWEVYYD